MEEQMKEAKMVIVVRVCYPDKNGEIRKIRSGKLMAQVGHASSAWLSSLVRSMIEDGKAPVLSAYEKKWIFERFKKICVYVNSEEELLKIYEDAKSIGLNSIKIIDSGLTEFSGEPTLTCISIGPDDPDKIDRITSGLPLL